MPRRSNPFQRLIELLERQLAPIDAKVHGSHMLTDSRTGEPREVDIVIEAASGIHPIQIGIEVIDQKRPASSPWVEGIHQKHEDLPINKTILVSKSGFYKPALAKARALNMDTLTIEEAEETDWTSKLDNIPFIRLVSFLIPQITAVTVVLDESADGVFDASELEHLDIFTASGHSRGTPIPIILDHLHHQKTLATIEESAFTDSGTLIEGEVLLEKGSYVVDKDGGRHLVGEIRFTATCKKQVTEMKLHKGRYRNVAAVAATGDTFGHPVEMILSQANGQTDPVVTIRVPKRALTNR